MKNTVIICLFIVLFACTGYPDNIKPVAQFDLDKYLGTWYEVARLDHSFERGMDQVTATYARRADGGVQVLNKGYDTQKKEWDVAEGKAYFVNNSDIAHLKVSFFGPFYGSYVVFKIDADYQYAYIAGNNHKYLWLLSRTPQVSHGIKQDFIQMATVKGYATDELIWVNQTSNIQQLTPPEPF